MANDTLVFRENFSGEDPTYCRYTALAIYLVSFAKINARLSIHLYMVMNDEIINITKNRTLPLRSFSQEGFITPIRGRMEHQVFAATDFDLETMV
jgi:hypothetical protein